MQTAEPALRETNVMTLAIEAAQTMPRPKFSFPELKHQFAGAAAMRAYWRRRSSIRRCPGTAMPISHSGMFAT